MSQAKITELDASNTCKLCENALSRYSCPKCGIVYCSLTCYQSPKHLQCSEDFYKECIVEELSLQDNSEAKRKMLEILERQKPEDESDILDSDDDEDLGHITERFANVDLDNADDVWDKLTPDEQQEFMAFLKSEDITKIVPAWEPWWEYTTTNITEVSKAEKYKENCPTLLLSKDFGSLTKKAAADCVKFNLVNVIGAYAFSARYFNGEYQDFPHEVSSSIVTLSLTLKNNQNFDSYNSALDSIQFNCIESDWIMADAENYKKLREDVDKIIKGPNESDSNYYIQSALSDCHRLLTSALSVKVAEPKSSFSRVFPNVHFPKVKNESKTKIKNCLKKIEYFLAFSGTLTIATFS